MWSWWTYASSSSVVMPGRTASPARRRISAASLPATRIRSMMSGRLHRRLVPLGHVAGVGVRRPTDVVGHRAHRARRCRAARGPRCACGSACTCVRCRTSTGRWPAGARPGRRRRELVTTDIGLQDTGPGRPRRRDRARRCSLGRRARFRDRQPGADRRGGGRDRRRDRRAVAAAGASTTGERAPGVGVEVQRPVVEPADPAAPRPSLDLTERREPGRIRMSTRSSTAVAMPVVRRLAAPRADDRHHRQRDVPRGRRRSRSSTGSDRRSSYQHRDIAFTTLPRPAGELRCRFATVNDVHFGEVEAGRIGGSDLGPISGCRRAARRTPR